MEEKDIVCLAFGNPERFKILNTIFEQGSITFPWEVNLLTLDKLQESGLIFLSKDDSRDAEIVFKGTEKLKEASLELKSLLKRNKGEVWFEARVYCDGFYVNPYAPAYRYPTSLTIAYKFPISGLKKTKDMLKAFEEAERILEEDLKNRYPNDYICKVFWHTLELRFLQEEEKPYSGRPTCSIEERFHRIF